MHRLLALLLLLACNTSGIADPPFDAAEIREATRPGRTYVWKSTVNGFSGVRRVRFIAVTPEGATMEATVESPDGLAIGPKETTTSTWDELVKHAAWPAAATKITDDKVSVEAGTFDCMLYTVTETKADRHMVTKAWFAKNLPGAPVKMLVTVDGQEVTSLELVEHKPQ